MKTLAKLILGVSIGYVCYYVIMVRILPVAVSYINNGNATVTIKY